MKRSKTFLCALLLLALLLSACGQQEAAPMGRMINWTDPVFEAAVRSELAKPEGPIFEGDLREIRQVVIRSNLVQFGGALSVGDHHPHNRNPGVQSLDDLLHFPSILILDVSFTNISDFTPLAKLGDLQRLNLYHNPNMTDLSPLAGLKLVTLVINDLPVEDFSPILEISTLVNLEVYRTGLVTLDMAGRFPNLRRLNLNRNEIADISFLAGYTDLTYLDLRENRITDLSPLAGMRELFSLSIGGNPFSDISVLAGMPNLRQLSMQGTNVSDLSPLSELRWLSLLNLSDGQIHSLEPLARLRDLRTLDVSHNQITSLRPLENLPGLLELNVADNLLTDVSPLHNMRWLRQLNVSLNGLTPTQIAALERALAECEVVS